MKKNKTKSKREWTAEDFVMDLESVMKEQERKDPKFKRVHARLEPEWGEMTKLIAQILSAPEEATETNFIEKLISYKEKALYPLIELLLSFKRIRKTKEGE